VNINVVSDEREVRDIHCDDRCADVARRDCNQNVMKERAPVE
jgi:hypothetical protein